jgi:16S rRNA (uracil1498-N3)-methyltransferase
MEKPIMNIFYLPDASLGSISLSEEESKHCVRVLRMIEGTKLLITNGRGQMMEAMLTQANPKRCQLEIFSVSEGEDQWQFHLHIAVAPTKNSDRIEWFLEKATEVGVDEISLFSSEHSERRSQRHDRLEKVMISAMKQSLKSRLPKLNEMTDYEQIVKSEFSGQKFIAWIDSSITETLINAYQKSSNAIVLIGPEGDFSPLEVELAIKNGFVPVSLGKARLRTETAALAACMTIQLKNQLK